MPVLAVSFKVIVVDSRGMGSSGKPLVGYDKKNMNLMCMSLLKSLGMHRL
jgi:hypothetical protein